MILFQVTKFHQYLFADIIFITYSDHKPLMYIFGESKSIPSVASARVQRWALILSAYRTDNLRNIFLRNTFATFGPPEILVIDNGTNFSSSY